MFPITPQLKQKGVKDWYTEFGSEGRVKKQYSYRKMIISWDSKKPLDKFYYWRMHYFTSIEGAMRAIDRHYKHFKNNQSDRN